MCLKHFRQQNYLSVFDMLQKKTKIQLEDPVLSELHDALVQAGDHETTERLITNAIDGRTAYFILRTYLDTIVT